MIWEHELDWPGAVGGFVGRSSGGRADQALAGALGSMGGERTLVEAQQTHGARVARVTDEMLRAGDGPVVVRGVDGLLAESPRAALAIYVADCLAIYLYHPARPAVGLAHGGWRGLATGIAGKLVRAALRGQGGSPADLRIALSPCIRVCCFEVGAEVAARFDGIPGAVDRSRDRPHVDMVRVAQEQLVRAGVARDRIEVMAGCTRCEPERFASYRRDPDRCGRNVALIGLEGRP